MRLSKNKNMIELRITIAQAKNIFFKLKELDSNKVFIISATDLRIEKIIKI